MQSRGIVELFSSKIFPCCITFDFLPHHVADFCIFPVSLLRMPFSLLSFFFLSFLSDFRIAPFTPFVIFPRSLPFIYLIIYVPTFALRFLDFYALPSYSSPRSVFPFIPSLSFLSFVYFSDQRSLFF